MIIFLSLLVAIVGLLMYALGTGRVSAIGLVAFGSGLTAFLIRFGPESLRLM